MKRALRSALAVVCILVISVCLALIINRLAGGARLDLTEDKLYTLSAGTRSILAKLNQPVRLKLYYSRAAAMKGPEEIRFYNSYYVYVRDLLEEYVKLSNGRLRLTVIDPRRFTDEEDEAIAHGVKQFPISEDENFFFGLVAQTELGKEKVIPFFEPNRQEFVEYDISKLIASVTQREKRKVGVLSPLPVMGTGMSPYMLQMLRMQGRQPSGPWTIITHLQDRYEVTTVEKDADEIPEDIDFLMVVHPKELPEKTLFAIDQFVMRGGKLIVFVDPHCLSDRPVQPQMYAPTEQRTSSDLNALLEKWGVEMVKDKIVTDPALAIRTMLNRNQRPELLLTYLNLNEECMNMDEVITADLHSVRLLFAGVLKPLEVEGVTVTPLMTTTREAGTWTPSSPFELMMPNAETVREHVESSPEPIVVACRITGKLQTNFPDGPPGEKKEKGSSSGESEEEKKEASGEKEESNSAGDKEAGKGNSESAPPAKPSPEGDAAEPAAEAEKPKEAEVIAESPDDATVIVVADVDVISDLLAYQETFFGMAQVGDNASLVFNSLDFLSGSGDLIHIRSRGQISRPFKVVDRIEVEAEKATADKEAAINEKIKEYEEKLRKLGAQVDEKNVRLVASAALAERKKLQGELRKLRKEKRQLLAAKRSRIERLKVRLQTHAMVWAPVMVLAVAVVLALGRYIKARRYAARRMEG